MAGEEDSNKMWKCCAWIIPDKTLWEMGESRAELTMMALERKTWVLNTATACYRLMLSALPKPENDREAMVPMIIGGAYDH